MRWNKVKGTLLLYCFTIILLASFAQSKLDSLQILNEVVVTACTYQDIIPSQKLSGKQLEVLNSHSVADALRYFAGVQIKDYGGMGGLKTVNIRNMGSVHVGVFYNGVNAGNAQNGTVDLGKFSLDDIEEISLYNGQRSEIFQSAKDYASASAVYIRAKRPKFEDNKNTNVTVRYKGGSIRTENSSFRLEQKLNSKFSLSLSSEYLYSSGKYKFHFERKNADNSVAHDTTAYRKNSDIKSFRVESSLYGVFNDESTWETNLYYYSSDRGLPGAIVKKKFNNGERLEDKSFFIQSSYTKNVTDKYKIQLKGKFAYDYTHYNSLDTVSVFDGTPVYRNMLYDNKYYQQEVYATLINKYSILPNWDVALSVDLGKCKAQASIIGTFVHEKVRNNTKAPDKTEFTPALLAGYKPFAEHDLNLRFFYKRIFVCPPSMIYTILKWDTAC